MLGGGNLHSNEPAVEAVGPYAGTLSSRVNLQPLQVPVPVMQNARIRHRPLDNLQVYPDYAISRAAAAAAANMEMLKNASINQRVPESMPN